MAIAKLVMPFAVPSTATPIAQSPRNHTYPGYSFGLYTADTATDSARTPLTGIASPNGEADLGIPILRLNVHRA